MKKNYIYLIIIILIIAVLAYLAYTGQFQMALDITAGTDYGLGPPSGGAFPTCPDCP